MLIVRQSYLPISRTRTYSSISNLPKELRESMRSQQSGLTEPFDHESRHPGTSSHFDKRRSHSASKLMSLEMDRNGFAQSTCMVFNAEAVSG